MLYQKMTASERAIAERLLPDLADYDVDKIAIFLPTVSPSDPLALRGSFAWRKGNRGDFVQFTDTDPQVVEEIARSAIASGRLKPFLKDGGLG